MTTVSADSPELHEAFLRSTRRHLLNITNHGIHQWEIVPGLPDTGGQNVFVNHLTATLAQLGFRITVVNRGGYPHPTTGEPRQGLCYRDAHQRILFLQDSRPELVAKEQMAALIPELAHDMGRSMGPEEPIALMISHYWDGAAVGVAYNQSRSQPAPHVWVPHSVGTIKQRNMDPGRWADLRLDERIAAERQLVPQIDNVAATSQLLRTALSDDYGVANPLFLPPCVDPDRYAPRQVDDDDPLWEALARQTGIEGERLRGQRIITEVSRTDRTKRKDLLLRAFARVAARHADCLLVVTIDDRQQPLADELRQLIASLDLVGRVAPLGSIWDLLPSLYAATSIYCTPSVMEGFGMSAQEAAACGAPVVASDLVPFAVEHLLGQQVDTAEGIRQGEAAMVVPANDADQLARALDLLLSDETLRRQMGRRAFEITIPEFTWRARTADFLRQCGIDDEATQP